MEGKNLYEFIQYGIIWDKFFYSPSFAVMFIPFTLLPLKLAVPLWILMGAMIFRYALNTLPLSNPQKTILFFIVLIDLINSMQNLQTNALCAALSILIFSGLHNGKIKVAALCTALCFCIKIYPAAPALLFLFYPQKLKFLTWSLVFFILLFALPFLFSDSAYVISCFKNWFTTLIEDTNPAAVCNAPSFIGINYAWFPHPIRHVWIQIAGLTLLFAPLTKLFFQKANLPFLLRYFAFILISIILFNHAAESPGYIFVASGCGIWYALSNKSHWDNALLIFLFVGCILLPTDLYPSTLRKEYFEPLKIRTFPAIIIWGLLLRDLLRKSNLQPTQQVSYE